MIKAQNGFDGEISSNLSPFRAKNLLSKCQAECFR